MTFSEELKELEATPEELMALTECSQRTAYSWLSGERSPKLFIQRLTIESLQRIRAAKALKDDFEVNERRILFI